MATPVPVAPDGERLLYPKPEAAYLIGGIAVGTVEELIARGELTAVKLGRRRFVTAASIEAYVARLVTSAAA